jgi:hypothetical protein
LTPITSVNGSRAGGHLDIGGVAGRGENRQGDGDEEELELQPAVVGEHGIFPWQSGARRGLLKHHNMPSRPPANLRQVETRVTRTGYFLGT